MKRIIAVIACFCIMISFVGCKEPDFEEEVVIGGSEAETESDPEEVIPPNTFKLKTARVLSEGKRAVPYYSETAVSMPLPEGFERKFIPTTAQSVIFENEEGASVTVRELYKVDTGYSPDDNLCAYAESFTKSEGNIIFTLTDGSFEGYTLLDETYMLHLIIKGMELEEASEVLKNVKNVPDTFSEVQIQEFMSMAVLFFHEVGAEENITAADALCFVAANLWQSVNIAPMKVSDDGESVTVKAKDVQMLCDRFFGQDRFDVSAVNNAKGGISYNSEKEEYTFSILESSVYESFPETYFLRNGTVGVEKDGESVQVVAVTEHTTISLGTTSTSTLKYKFTEKEYDGFTYLKLERIDF